MSDLYTHLPFSGSNTALVTPFTPDGRLDESTFEKLVDWQIEQGTHGLIPVGTTGESPTLSCLLYTSPSPRDRQKSRMPSSA